MHDPIDTHESAALTSPATPLAPSCRRTPGGLTCPCTEGGPCLCAASRDKVRLSPGKCALALALVGAIGSFMMLKPDPAGVRAGAITQVPEDQLRAIVLRNGNHPISDTDPSHAALQPLGTLEGSTLNVLIEAQGTGFVYTVTDTNGSELATRATREELQSLLPHLDLDSLTASPDHPRLMLAEDRGDH